MDDLPVETIIIVACVCGTIVLILTIVLIILCWRRHQAKKNFEKAEASRTMQARASSPQPDRNGGPMTGIVNGGMDSPDVVEDTRPPVYTTSTSQLPHMPNGNAYVQYNPHAESRGNGYMPSGQPDWSPNSNLPPYPYMSDQEMNSKNAAREQAGHYQMQSMDNKVNLDHTHRDEPHYLHEPSKEIHHTGSDSGVSTPDPQKPKKVIYEVIV